LAYAETLSELGLPTSKLDLKAVIFTSESCLSHQRGLMSKTFGCPVVPEYGCSEVDIIAFGCPHGGFHLNAENVLVEVIPCGDAPPGSGEVIVTDLNNLMMPLIRYRLGDLAALSGSTCSCGRGLPMLEHLSGRSQGQFILTARGDRVHSQTLAYLFENLASEGFPLQQFQIVQLAVGHLRVLIAPEEVSRADRQIITDRIQEEATALLAESCRIEVEFRNDIDGNREGRKFRHFESLLPDPHQTDPEIR